MLLILLVVGMVSIFSALYIAETVVNTPGDHHLPGLAEEHLGGFGFAFSCWCRKLRSAGNNTPGVDHRRKCHHFG